MRSTKPTAQQSATGSTISPAAPSSIQSTTQPAQIAARQLGRADLNRLFQHWAAVMSAEKTKLTDLDSVVGDGDLGLTMSDGFAAAYQAIQASRESDIGRLVYTAGKAMSTAVPSTMGTLMASGLMQVGKAFKGQSTITAAEFGRFFSAYFEGVKARGKAELGEKTFLDGLYPALSVLHSASNDMDWALLAQQAYAGAQQGALATQQMLAVHGRAAGHGEKSRHLLDPGAYVAKLLLAGYAKFVDELNDSDPNYSDPNHSEQSPSDPARSYPNDSIEQVN
ncbi:dihydroxyacetone kinase subunit L [Utexia brackfieldae]|uniref:dihydroxyacetone kinase subunit L n=1 Tax=Utexia brackfieldae TaxID=3074108 RepID=UPI00370D116B